MIIYPSLDVRQTQSPIEIDDNDPEFIRDPLGLYAVYYGVEPCLLLAVTETYGEWDTITGIRAVHLERLRWLIDEVLSRYTTRT